MLVIATTIIFGGLTPLIQKCLLKSTDDDEHHSHISVTDEDMDENEKKSEKKDEVKALNASKTDKIGGGHHEDNTFTHREIF